MQPFDISTDLPHLGELEISSPLRFFVDRQQIRWGALDKVWEYCPLHLLGGTGAGVNGGGGGGGGNYSYEHSQHFQGFWVEKAAYILV